MSRYAGSAPCWRPARPTRAVPGVIICASSAVRGHPAGAGGRSPGARRTHRGWRHSQGVLPGHAAAPRRRGGAARGPAGADSRRAGQRIDPAGIRSMRDLLRTLAAHGRTRPAVQPPAGGDELLADDLIIIVAGRLAARAPWRPSSSMAHRDRTRAHSGRRETGRGARQRRDGHARGGADVYVTGADAVTIGDAAAGGRRRLPAGHRATGPGGGVPELTRGRRPSDDLARQPGPGPGPQYLHHRCGWLGPRS